MKKLSVMAVLGVLCAALFCCHYASDYRVRVRRHREAGHRVRRDRPVYTIEEDGASSVRKFGYELTRDRMLPFGSVSRIGGVE